MGEEVILFEIFEEGQPFSFNERFLDHDEGRRGFIDHSQAVFHRMARADCIIFIHQLFCNFPVNCIIPGNEENFIF